MVYYYALVAIPVDGRRPRIFKSRIETWEEIMEVFGQYDNTIIDEFDVPCTLQVVKYGSALSLQRQIMGISQQKLADETKIPVRTIRAWEQGTRDICNARVDRLQRLASALNCGILDIAAAPIKRHYISFK